MAHSHSPWLTPRGDASGSGYVAHRLPENLSVRWETETGESIESAPVVGAGAVYVADVMGGVESLHLRNGESRWRIDLETGFIASPALFLPETLASPAGDRFVPIVGPAPDANQRKQLAQQLPSLLIVGDVTGTVRALDPDSGKTVWEASTQGEIYAAANFFLQRDEGGEGFAARVLVTSQDGSLYCLDLATGENVWTYQTNDQIRCAPSIGGGKTFLGGCDAALHVVDLATGKAARKPFPLQGPTGSTPAVMGRDIYLPIMDSIVYRFNVDEDSPQWQYEDPDRTQEYRTNPAVGPHTVIVTSRGKNVDALDRDSGKRRWRYTLRRRAAASPIIAGQDVWIASTDGRLIRLGLADGEKRWEYEIRGSFYGPPAVLDDALVIADDDGVVRCFAANP